MQAAWDRPVGPALVLVTCLALPLIVAALGLVAWPGLSDRKRPKGSAPASPLADAFIVLPVAGLALVVSATTLVASNGAGPWTADTNRSLPGLVGLLQVTIAAQAVLVLVVLVTALLLRWVAMRHAYPERTGSDGDAAVSSAPALGGTAPATFALLGALLIDGSAAGLTFAIARLPGYPLEFIQLFLPSYTANRVTRTPRAVWTNIYIPADVLGSSFGDDGHNEVHGEIVTDAQIGQLRLAYNKRYTDMKLTLLNMWGTHGFLSHARYWDEVTAGSCLPNAREMSGSGLSPGLLVGGHVE